MPFQLGPFEATMVFVILLILFGPGRIGKLGGELGKAIKELRDSLKE